MFAGTRATICLTTIVLQLIVQAHSRSTGDYDAATHHRPRNNHHHHHHHHKYHHHNHHRHRQHNDDEQQQDEQQYETKQLLRFAEVEEPWNFEDNDDEASSSSLVPQLRVRREHPRFNELVDNDDQSQIDEADNSEEASRYHRARESHPRSGRHRVASSSPTESSSSSSSSERKPHANGTHDPFLYDISAAHGKTVCPYEIVPVPEERGREPRNLLHLTCLKRGSACRGVDLQQRRRTQGQEKPEFCCIQLYRDIELRWDGGRPNTWLRLNSGCVCTENKYMPLHRFESSDANLNE